MRPPADLPEDLFLAGYVPLMRQGYALPCFASTPQPNIWYTARCDPPGDHCGRIVAFETFPSQRVCELPAWSLQRCTVESGWRDVFLWDDTAHVGGPSDLWRALEPEIPNLRLRAPLSLFELALDVPAADRQDLARAAHRFLIERRGRARAEAWRREMFRSAATIRLRRAAGPGVLDADGLGAVDTAWLGRSVRLACPEELVVRLAAGGLASRLTRDLRSLASDLGLDFTGFLLTARGDQAPVTRPRRAAALEPETPSPVPPPDPDPLRASDAIIQRLRANHPTLIDLTTGRVERLLAALGRPDLRLPAVIHVAGTNGKGSTVAYLRAIAEAAGLKAHVLTSPHLVRFAERIRLAGQLITDANLRALTDRVETANAGEPISFFEITTVLALLAFAETPADVCIVEVGLGGRFDATNVFEAPAVSVITPVDYDHLEMLGPGLPKIAWEKAGIIKTGRPVVVARQPDEALEMIEREADDRMAPMLLMGRDFDAWEERGRLIVQMPDRRLDLPAPSLFGGYQFANAGLAVAAALTLQPAFTNEQLGRGVTSTVLPARMQRLTAGPLAKLAKARGADLWLDGGHNPYAGRALAEAASRLIDPDPRPLALDDRPRPLVLVTGMFARKDAEGFFLPFAEMRPRVIATTFDSPIAASAVELAQAAGKAGLKAETAADVVAGVSRALEMKGPAPHVIICGGLHFAGEVLAMDRKTWPR